MSGIDGVAGMRLYATLPSIPGQNGAAKPLTLIGRPLLGMPKVRLIETCKRFGVQPIYDPGNERLGYLRNSVRTAFIQIQSQSTMLKTEDLQGLLNRLKEYRNESQLQLRKIFEENVIFNSLAFNKSTVENDPGDALLMFPRSAQWWITNPYLMTRLFNTLVQYVCNLPTLGGYSTVSYSTHHICRVFKSRFARDDKIKLQSGNLSDIKRLLSIDEPVTLSPPEQSIDKLTGNETLNKRRVFGLSTDPNDPCRRIPGFKTFNISGVQIFPMGGRDTYARLSLLSKDKTAMELGPTMLFCRAAPKKHFTHHYFLDVEFELGRYYCWDNRLLFSIRFPHAAESYAKKDDGDEIVILPPLNSFKLPRTKDGSSENESSKQGYIKGLTPSYKKAQDNTSPPYILPDHYEPNMDSSSHKVIVVMRIVLLTTEALKYLIDMVHTNLDKETLRNLEIFKKTTPSKFFHSHPLCVDMTHKRWYLPTLGLSVDSPGKSESQRLHWKVKVIGVNHFFNRMNAPSSA